MITTNTVNWNDFKKFFLRKKSEKSSMFRTFKILFGGIILQTKIILIILDLIVYRRWAIIKSWMIIH